eukprot:scaffold16396_cov115-Isochrysis_galbana.AAC.5
MCRSSSYSSSPLPASSLWVLSSSSELVLAGSCTASRDEMGACHLGPTLGLWSAEPVRVDAALFHDRLVSSLPSAASSAVMLPSSSTASSPAPRSFAAPRHERLTCSPPRSLSARAASSLRVGSVAEVISRTISLQSPNSLRSTSASMRVACREQRDTGSGVRPGVGTAARGNDCVRPRQKASTWAGRAGAGCTADALMRCVATTPQTADLSGDVPPVLTC